MTNKIFAFSAVLALAFAAQAETTTWQSNFYTGAAVAADPIDGGTALYGKTMYIVCGELGNSDLWSIVNVRNEEHNPVNELDFVVAQLSIDKDFGTGPDGDFALAEGKAISSESVPNYYLVMVMRATEDAGNPLYGKYFMSDAHAADGYDEYGGTDIDMGAEFAQTRLAGHWRPLAIPEPTSGLLLLIGFAGLALKRRRV